MGMRLTYRSISDSEIVELSAGGISGMDWDDEDASPAGADLLSGALDSELLRRVLSGRAELTEVLGKLESRASVAAGRNGANRGAGGRGRRGGGNEIRGSLDKLWHGLHFVLTGSAGEAQGPLAYLLCGGREVGEDLGYGPARALTSGDTAAFRDALAAVSDEEFDRRFDLAALAANEIYPDIWDEDRDELLEEFLDALHALQRDLSAIVKSQQGMLIAIT